MRAETCPGPGAPWKERPSSPFPHSPPRILHGKTASQLRFPAGEMKGSSGGLSPLIFSFLSFKGECTCRAPVLSHPIRSPGVRSRWSLREGDPHTWPSSRLQERGPRWPQAHPAGLGGQTDQVASIPSLGARPRGSGIHVDSVASTLARGSPFEALCCQERLFCFKPKCRLTN